MNNTDCIPSLQGAKLTGKNGHVYRFQKMLGRGTFGVVYRCVEEGTSQMYACKVMNKAQLSNCLTNVLREIDIMMQIQHERLLNLHEYLCAGDLMFLFTRYIPGGNLTERMSFGRMSVADAGAVVYQILQGVAYLHQNHICHRDIKPDNILCNNLDPSAEPDVVIADFGLSRSFGRDELMSSHCGSTRYAAPEVFNTSYTEACDIWSIGIVLSEMLFGDDSYNSTYRCLQEQRKGFDETDTEGTPVVVRDFLAKLLQYEPAKRLTAVDALRHPWMLAVAEKRALTPAAEPTAATGDVPAGAPAAGAAVAAASAAAGSEQQAPAEASAHGTPANTAEHE